MDLYPDFSFILKIDLDPHFFLEWRIQIRSMDAQRCTPCTLCAIHLEANVPGRILGLNNVDCHGIPNGNGIVKLKTKEFYSLKI